MKLEITQDLRGLCQEFLDTDKKNVNGSGHSASGKLENSAKYQITFDGKYFEIYFILEDYWKYLEYGTKPHFPPIKPIEDWIRVKKIVPYATNGKVPTTKQLAYKIAYSINEKGTKAAKVLDKTMNEADILLDRMVEVITKQIEEQIDIEI